MVITKYIKYWEYWSVWSLSRILDNNYFKISRAPWKEWHPLLKWKVRNHHNLVACLSLGSCPRTSTFHTELANLLTIFEWCLEINNSQKAMPSYSQDTLELFIIIAMGHSHNSKQDGSHQVNMQKWDLLYFENHWPEEGRKRIQTQSFNYYYSFKVTAQIWRIPS